MADKLSTDNPELTRLFAEVDDLDPADQEWVLDRLRRNIEHVLQAEAALSARRLN